jgi:hypothetical protein
VTDSAPTPGTIRLDLNQSEAETVREALENLMTGLSGVDDADQIDEVQRLLAQLPRDGSLYDGGS